MHKRKEIKVAAKAIILNKTGCEDRVETMRFVPFGEDEMPFTAIYCGAEPVERIDNITEKRTLELVFEVIAMGPDVEDDLDTLTSQIETAMIQDETLSGTVHEIVLTKTEHGYDEVSKTTIQSMKLTYSAVYFTEAVADSPTDPFESADVKYNEGSFSDQVTLPQ